MLYTVQIRVVHCSEEHSVTSFLAPGGQTIKGRRAALQHMVAAGSYSQEKLDRMRSHLNVLS